MQVSRVHISSGLAMLYQKLGRDHPRFTVISGQKEPMKRRQTMCLQWKLQPATMFHIACTTWFTPSHNVQLHLPFKVGHIVSSWQTGSVKNYSQITAEEAHRFHPAPQAIPCFL
jgi:hypothetical protein